MEELIRSELIRYYGYNNIHVVELNGVLYFEIKVYPFIIGTKESLKNAELHVYLGSYIDFKTVHEPSHISTKIEIDTKKEKNGKSYDKIVYDLLKEWRY